MKIEILGSFVFLFFFSFDYLMRPGGKPMIFQQNLFQIMAEWLFYFILYVLY